MNKIDLVIQGQYTNFTDEIVSSYLNLPFINKIIISCWETDKEQTIFSDKVEFVRISSYKKYPGPANVNLQLATSLSGVKKSDSNLVAKFRSDQLLNLEGIDAMYQFFIENLKDGRIFVVGNHFNLLFHPKDWIYWGYRKDMINLFDIPHEVNDVCEQLGVNSKNYSSFMHLMTRAETYIGAYYCSRFDDRVLEMINNQNLYLYDGSLNWNYAKKVSDEIMPKVFKSFPRQKINMIWPKKNIYCFPFDPTSEGWDEEGF
jgi:hypothetical protein